MKLAALLIVLLSIIPEAISPVRAIDSTITVSAIVPGTTSNTGNLRMTGHGSPLALVTFLRNGVVGGTTTCDSTGLFDKTLTSLDPGAATFSMYGTDSDGRSTLTLSFTTSIVANTTLTLSGFLLPPTIAIKNTTLKRPQTQSTNGSARSNATVTAIFNSDTITKQVGSGTDGRWQASVSETFHLGKHSTYALVQDGDGSQSNTSQVLSFTVVLSADLNNDDHVNLTDFSILMFNYGRSDFPNKAADINDEGKVDLVDFSVMMFYWTGG